MSIDGPRFAAFLAFTERGFTPDDASACVMALHPLDDAPVPDRSFEKAVRARSRSFAKDAKRAPSTTALRLAHEALSEYRTLAFQLGEHYYQTRYDQYLPAPLPHRPERAVTPNPPASPRSASVGASEATDAWWSAPSEPAPPPPPVESLSPPTTEGVNASWGYAAPPRPQSSPASMQASPPPMPPPLAGQRATRSGASGGAAPARSFGEAVEVCLKKYAVFNGRASRSEYWYFALFTFVATFSVTLIGVALPLAGLGDLLGTLIQLALLIPGIAVGVRRMHDLDLSGWFVLVPIYNIVLLASKGSDGPNRFG